MLRRNNMKAPTKKLCNVVSYLGGVAGEIEQYGQNIIDDIEDLQWKKKRLNAKQRQMVQSFIKECVQITKQLEALARRGERIDMKLLDDFEALVRAGRD